MTDDPAPTVLVVDDEQGLAGLYAIQLDDRYATRTACGGQAALEAMDDEVAAVLLDRRMPGLSRAEVLETLRERGYDQPVAMLTAIAPGEDIRALPVDDYVVKPVTGDRLRATVEALLDRRRCEDAVRSYLAVASKAAAMEANRSRDELEASEAYQSLRAELSELGDRTESARTDLPPEDGLAGFRR